VPRDREKQINDWLADAIDDRGVYECDECETRIMCVALGNKRFCTECLTLAVTASVFG
jgi:hypothetical protein